jgi:hypothetical protein
MKVDSQPFPQANVVELSDFCPVGQNFAFQINMAGPTCRRDEQRREAVSGKRPQDEDESEHNILLKKKCVTSVTSSQLLIGFLKNLSISTSCVAGINRKKRSTSTAR